MNSCPILRRNAGSLFKHAGEIQAVLKARKPSDLLNGHPRSLPQAQKPLGVRNADLSEVFQRGNPHFLFEKLTEIIGVHMNVSHYLTQVVKRV